MKKIALCLLLLCKIYAQPFDGFYFGGNGGGKIATSEGYTTNNLGYYDLFPNMVTHSLQEPCDAHRQNYFGSVYVGYGLSFCAVFLGVEGFLNFPKHEIIRQRCLDYHLNFGPEEADFVRIHQNLSDTFSATSRAVEYGVDFKSGFLLSDYALLYWRVGAAFNRFNLKSHAVALYEDSSRGFVPPPDLPAVSVSEPLFLHHYTTVKALRLGVGFEHYITQNWSITLDYIYTCYGDLSLMGQKDTVVRDRTLPKGLSINSSTCLRSQAVVFGIASRFCLSNLWYGCW